MTFPLDWHLTANLLTDGMYCNGVMVADADPQGSPLQSLGPAGTYRWKCSVEATAATPRGRSNWSPPYSLHATKKLRDRAKPPILPAVADPTTYLGNWYCTVLFWRPQLALLVNEQTLIPVLMPLAPAATVLDRFPAALSHTLAAAGVERRFIDSEVAEMSDGQWTKTASRSVLGTMNQFSFLANDYHDRHDFDPMGLALWLAQTPCGPLYGRHISPDRELAAAIDLWSTEQNR